MFCQYFIALDGIVVCCSRVSESYPFVPGIARQRRKQRAVSCFAIRSWNETVKRRAVQRTPLSKKGANRKLRSVHQQHRIVLLESKIVAYFLLDRISKAGQKEHIFPLIERPPTTCRNGETHFSTYFAFPTRTQPIRFSQNQGRTLPAIERSSMTCRNASRMGCTFCVAFSSTKTSMVLSRLTACSFVPAVQALSSATRGRTSLLKQPRTQMRAPRQGLSGDKRKTGV
jgi:hypothetical protein